MPEPKQPSVSEIRSPENDSAPYFSRSTQRRKATFGHLRVPTINPCDYFLWVFLKEQVFRQHPEDLLELRACIVLVCNTIDDDLCRRVVQN
ncbi:hypothetical protein C0J52_09239 [Blattella germanica]|nr:hypothetical protein C0J52_09239 [Blattella germanica]